MRKMWKKVLPLCLAAILCLGLVPAAAAADVPTTGWKLEEILPCRYDELDLVGEDMFLAKLNGKWGVMDQTGKTMIDFTYDSLEYGFYYEGAFVSRFVAWKDGKWGLLDAAGKEVIPFQYDEMYPCWNEDLLLVRQNDKWGYIDAAGEVRIPPTWKEAGVFHSGLAAVQDDAGKWGYIDTNGNIVLACAYSAAGDFDGGIAPVQTADGTWQFIGPRGAVEITCQGQYDQVESFYGDFAVVTRNGKEGMIDQTGREVMECKYDMVLPGEASSEWNPECWTAYGNKKTYPNGFITWQYGMRSVDGTVDTGMIYECDWEVYPSPFYQGLTPVSKATGKLTVDGYPIYTYGYLDQTGKEAIPCRYDFAGDFREGPAPVELDGKAGFIDATGETVIPMIYTNASEFNDSGLATVATGSYPNLKWRIIGLNGETVTECSEPYEWISLMYGGKVWTNRDGKVGLLALTRNGTEGLELPINGEMTSSTDYRWVSYSCSELGYLDLYGDLAPEDMVLAAGYDDGGKLIDLSVLTADKVSAWLDTAAAKVKLFWLGDRQAPQSAAATFWERP